MTVVYTHLQNIEKLPRLRLKYHFVKCFKLFHSLYEEQIQYKEATRMALKIHRN